MHLFTPQAQMGCLTRAYGHLRAGGLFIVDVFAPSYAALIQEPDAPFKVRRRYRLVNGNRVVRKERFVKNDPVMQIQHSELRLEEISPSGDLVRERVVPVDMRYTFRYELELLLEKAGFDVVDVFRYYDRNVYDGTGEIIMVGTKSG